MMIRLATVALIAGTLGCGRVERQDAAQAPTMTEKSKSILPRPDPFRMAYNADTRTLNLYDLNGVEGHWMMMTPRNAKGEPVSVDHVFMDDVDLDSVSVFYTTASGISSPKVTLREIVTVNVAQGQ